MPASFVLRLDTTAPEITWGPVDGAVLGEEFTIQYVISEDGWVVSAELELADGRKLPMLVESDTLRVQLPEDTPEGLGTVCAYVTDDVDNTATVCTTVPISGVTIVPPYVPPAGGPPEREPAKRWVTAARTRSRFRVIHGGAATVSSMRATARYTIHRSTLRSSRSRAWTASHGRIRTHSTATVSSAGLREDWQIERRPEGPQAEEELLVLGLL